MAPRQKLIARLEQVRGSRVICYLTSDRKNQDAQIGEDVLPVLSHHLDRVGRCPRLDLLLYSRGGNTLTGFAIANALREFAERVSVLVPFRAHSCATLIALSADELAMGPFGQLTPIDPAITTPHGPTIERQGNLQFIPVSVEDVANYLQLARKEVGLSSEEQMAGVLAHLCARVNPLALGAVYRAREQIGMLATKMLRLHMTDASRIDHIVRTLTRELLSHDYVITRREAKEMGLPVAEVPAEVASLMWDVYDDAARELRIAEPWNPEKEAKAGAPVRTTTTRALVESRDLRHGFRSTYEIRRLAAPRPGAKAEALQVTSVEDGWTLVD